jgi:hypothetical protein
LNKTVVVLMGVMLITTTLTLSSNSFAAKPKGTVLSLEMSGCTNSLTCNAHLMVGDTVTFTGTLTTEDGDPISGAQIEIIKFIPKPELVVIASGVTGIDGAYDLSWTAEFTEIEKAPQDVTKKMLSENVVIYADFAGDEGYGAARSGKNTAIIEASALKTLVNSDMNLYRQGDSALVFIAFLDSSDRFVDPDSIRVVLNEQEVEIEQKKTGSYTLSIPNLPKEHTQLFVLPKKPGYNTENGFLTLIVDGLK